jgi:hypothetical protein
MFAKKRCSGLDTKYLLLDTVSNKLLPSSFAKVLPPKWYLPTPYFGGLFYSSRFGRW